MQIETSMNASKAIVPNKKFVSLNINCNEPCIIDILYYMFAY